MAKVQDLESALADLKQEVSNTAQRVLDKLANLDSVPDADIADIRSDIESLKQIAADAGAAPKTDHLGQPVTDATPPADAEPDSGAENSANA